MVAQCTECGNTQVEDLVFQMSAKTEVYLGKSATENGLVVTVNLTITIGALVSVGSSVCSTMTP